MEADNLRYLNDEIRHLREAGLSSFDRSNGASYDRSDHAAQSTQRPMTDLTRQEVDAKLETIEVRMDGRVAAIQASIDGFVGRMEERSLRTDDRFSRIEESQRETQASLGGLKSTIIITAISTVLAIVLGVAAFNATVLSNMVASFESGKSTSAAQAEVKRQSEETAALLKQMQQRLDDAQRNPSGRSPGTGAPSK